MWRSRKKTLLPASEVAGYLYTNQQKNTAHAHVTFLLPPVQLLTNTGKQNKRKESWQSHVPKNNLGFTPPRMCKGYHIGTHWKRAPGPMSQGDEIICGSYLPGIACPRSSTGPSRCRHSNLHHRNPSQVKTLVVQEGTVKKTEQRVEIK